MPYVNKEIRTELDEALRALLSKLDCYAPDKRDGILNYVITTLIDKGMGPGESYALYNRRIGVLECAKLELYRKKISKYEDIKCKANGDVYG